MIGTILIVILVLALLGVLPRWSHSKSFSCTRADGRCGTVDRPGDYFGFARTDLNGVHGRGLERGIGCFTRRAGAGDCEVMHG